MQPSSSYRRFSSSDLIIFVAVFVIVLAVLSAASLTLARQEVIRPNPENEWLGQIIEKKIAAAQAETNPKLLVVGGSNVLFGIRAGKLGTILHIPAYNLGTHFALGAKYPLYMAEKVAKPGDSVLLVFEFGVFAQQYEMGPTLARQVLFFDQDYLLEEPLGVLDVASGWSPIDYVKQTHMPRPSPPYTADRIDPHGDVDMTGIETTAAMQNRAASVPKRWPIVPPRDGLAFAGLKKFLEFAEENNIAVAATWPNFMSDPDYSSPQYLRAFEEYKEAFQSVGLTLIGKPEDAIFPREAVFDSPDHPGEQGAIRRTEHLAHLIAESQHER